MNELRVEMPLLAQSFTESSLEHLYIIDRSDSYKYNNFFYLYFTVHRKYDILNQRKIGRVGLRTVHSGPETSSLSSIKNSCTRGFFKSKKW